MIFMFLHFFVPAVPHRRKPIAKVVNFRIGFSGRWKNIFSRLQLRRKNRKADVRRSGFKAADKKLPAAAGRLRGRELFRYFFKLHVILSVIVK